MKVDAASSPDLELLTLFNEMIKSKLPHVNGSAGRVENPTPLVDLTLPLLQCARSEYGLNLREDIRVFGKLESQILSGSIKIRPAMKIFEDAIYAGRLRRGQTIFEATSGNFGIALGYISKLGLRVIALVSRKLQDGVLEELRESGVKLIDLDVDICPTPGLAVDTGDMASRLTADYLENELVRYGFDPKPFEEAKNEIINLLVRQDVINLSKLLARIYDGFCPEQYDNELNAESHEQITAKEIAQQLSEFGEDLRDYLLVCTFGTGGTSLGLSRFMQKKYGKKSVHVVFPLVGQEVAGIRTKEKAMGLKFYRPREYAGEHETDFEQAKKLLRFFVGRGYDIGESSALALYATVQMLNYGVGKKFVVVIADGAKKYIRNLGVQEEVNLPDEVTAEEVSSNSTLYGPVIWTHTMFVPKEDGLTLIASKLSLQKEKIIVLDPDDVRKILLTKNLPKEIVEEAKKSGKRLLFVCIAGSTSLNIARMMAKEGIRAQSLMGGIAGLLKYSEADISNVIQISH